MRRVRLNHVLKKRYTDIGVSAVLCLGMASAHAQSAEILLPGTTVQLDIAAGSEDCFTEAYSDGSYTPKAVCSADADALDGPQLRVIAESLASVTNQKIVSVATLSRSIQLPVPTSGPYSWVLPVQVATEVAWSGGTIVAGIDTTFAQVVATFQIRDITDATPESPGPVVASDTFLFERTDADFQIPAFPGSIFDVASLVNLVEIVDISNSSGADMTAFLERGRTYRIELEAKCDVEVPSIGWGVCLFSKDAQTILNLLTPTANGFPSWDNDGFAVSDITVTVGSDPAQGLAVAPQD